MTEIRVSGNGRYFVDEHGAPFFWLGDTQWELFRCFSVEDAQAVLERRKAQGFSVMQVMITGLGNGDGCNLDGQAPWLGSDPASPNEAFFTNVDRIVELLAQNDMIAVLGVYHKVQEERITCSNARGYARWLARRYADVPCVVWTMYPKAEPEFVPVMRELATGVQEGDGGTHMITVHPDPSPASSSFIHGESWLDFNMMQPCLDYESIHAMISKDYACTPPKPTVMAEGGYEGVNLGRLQTALEIRKQAYWSYLAGGHHSYGHNESNAAPAEWRSWIDSPGALHLGICRTVLTSLPEWWDLVPDQSLLADGEGQGLTLNVGARHESGQWALIYLAGSCSVPVRMERTCTGSAVEATWIDPKTGARGHVGGFPGSGVREFTVPEGLEDMLLLFERRDTRR